MRLWEILKDIDEGKVSKGTLFKGIENCINIILEYNGSSLIYNTIMNDNKTRETVSLCDGEMSLDYEMIAPQEGECVLFYNTQIKIKNGIGIFEDNFIDCINVICNDKTYEIVPIDKKFAVPYMSDGIVEVYYKKKVKGLIYNILCK